MRFPRMLFAALVVGWLGWGPAPIQAGAPAAPVGRHPDSPLLWHDASALVEGRGWTDGTEAFARLPDRAHGVVPDSVWGLSRQSAGLSIRFGTDAREIQAAWSLTSSSLGMPHMPPTGVSGLDLYVREPRGDWRWLAVGQPRAQTNTVTLVKDLPAGWHEFLLYLPLYNGTRTLEIGVPEGAAFKGVDPSMEPALRPVVFYGTSITQGGCASRPGMVHTAILGRRLKVPTINLGFSGSGRMEPALADLLAELDPSVYVLDCLPNMDAKLVAERVEPFVRRLREAHPRTPIVLVEDRFYTNGHLLEEPRRRNEANHAALRAAFQRLKKAGVRDLHYLPATRLLGSDDEATVDASHPTDLGFVRQAEAMAGVLKPLLRRAAR